jgi:RHS repeat-associated protein
MSIQTVRAGLQHLCGLLLVAALLVPMGAVAQTTVKYVHTDALGSVVAMTDASGAIVEGHREYEAYGQQLTPVVQDGPGYTGHVQDAATGLVYMQQRYYDPMLGKMLSVDPVTAYEKPITNFCRYCYARNNPYKFTDPDGRDSFLVSRPLDFPVVGGKANHNFIVHHADSPGDPNGTVRSFGITSNGTMGEVTPNTTGPNANTSAMDRAAWESIGSEGSNVTFRVINADDAVVQDNANSVSSAFNYSYAPEVSGGFNSNTAAGAVAQESDGGSPRVDNGRMQPGTSQGRIDAARQNVLLKPIEDKQR